ncbi:MAG: lysozyme, partial [Lachnospiraceae bacterium]|nr:lysozyme [Lachnospiraceae bacterium]
MKKKICSIIICVMGALWMTACASDLAAKETSLENTAESADGGTEAEQTDAESPEQDVETIETEETEILQFVDVFGQQYETVISNAVAKHSYDWSNLTSDGRYVSYEDDVYTSRVGIDVSYHQGEIDWQKVKDDGITFAFIRIGYRGYGERGLLCEDTKALEYIEEASQAGIDVGVYFFSQAINEEEALEEAEFVINQLQGIELQLPVVYDPESILDDEARTDDVSGEQFTKNTVVFCERIREAGYEPMIYSNMLWEAFEFDLE